MVKLYRVCVCTLYNVCTARENIKRIPSYYCGVFINKIAIEWYFSIHASKHKHKHTHSYYKNASEGIHRRILLICKHINDNDLISARLCKRYVESKFAINSQVDWKMVNITASIFLSSFFREKKTQQKIELVITCHVVTNESIFKEKHISMKNDFDVHLNAIVLNRLSSFCQLLLFVWF